MSYTIPYTFVPGTKARAQEVNANFSSIIDSFDDLDSKKVNLDLSNISEQGIDVIKNSAIARNIGEIVYSPLPLTDSGIHLLDGALINNDGIYVEFIKYIRNLYTQNSSADYFCTEAQWQSSVTQYGVCGKFVYNSTNNTVRLPKIGNQLYSTKTSFTTAPVSVRGNGMTLGVQGSWGYGGLAQLGNDSALTPYQGNYGNPLGLNRSGTHYASTNSVGLTTDASKSGIVGTADLSGVKIVSTDVFYYIVVATSAKTDIQVDIDNIAADLNGKADTDLTNVTNSAKVMMSGMGMPSSKYINLTLGSSGSTYTAPANGYYNIARTVSSQGQYVDLTNITTNFFISQQKDSSGLIRICTPVRKGDVLRINYTATGGGTYDFFRFFYAIGSESEAN